MIGSNDLKVAALPTQMPSADLRARVLASAGQTPGSLPGSWYRRVGAVTLGGAFWMTTLLAVFHLRRDWPELPVVYSFGTLGILVFASCVLTWLGTSRGPFMVGASAPWLTAVSSVLPLALVAWCFSMNATGPSSRVASSSLEALLLGSMCYGVTLCFALPILGASMWLRRGLITAAPRWTGACLGMASATWAHIVLHRHCDLAGPWHSVLAHLLPLFPLAVFGAWWESRRVSPARP